MFKKSLTTIIAFFAVITSPMILYAAPFTNPIAATDLYALLVSILNAVIYIIFPIIVLMIIYTGFLFIKAQGNPAKLEEARRALVWTIIGAIIVLGSWTLSKAIESTVHTIAAP